MVSNIKEVLMIFSKNKNTAESWQVSDVDKSEVEKEFSYDDFATSFAVSLEREAALPENPITLTTVNSATANEIPNTSNVKLAGADISVSAYQDIKRRFGSNIKSALGPGTVIEGTFSFDQPVCIDGTLTGQIQSTSVLIVGEQAEVNAKIEVGGIIVLGKVRGEIKAKELVEVRSTGELNADVYSPRLVIEDGAIFNGFCRQENF